MRERFAEIYCLECGYKEFYNLELKAGYSPAESSLAGKHAIKCLRDDPGMCPKCNGSPRTHFVWDAELPYKMGGYGEQRSAVFETFSCKKCAFSEFKDYLFSGGDFNREKSRA